MALNDPSTPDLRPDSGRPGLPAGPVPLPALRGGHGGHLPGRAGARRRQHADRLHGAAACCCCWRPSAARARPPGGRPPAVTGCPSGRCCCCTCWARSRSWPLLPQLGPAGPPDRADPRAVAAPAVGRAGGAVAGAVAGGDAAGPVRRAVAVQHGRARRCSSSAGCARRCCRAWASPSPLVFCFALTYVATERDVRVDFSYFRTSRPGESTKKIVRALDKPVSVHLFFPPANEVREEVETYFAELSRESKQLERAALGSGPAPGQGPRAGRVGQRRRSSSTRDTLREQLGVPLELDRARASCAAWTRTSRSACCGSPASRRSPTSPPVTTSAPTRPARTTSRHERRASIRALRNLLTDQGFEPQGAGPGPGAGHRGAGRRRRW